MDVPFKRLNSVPPADIRRFAGEVISRAPRCDALYLPCPQWQGAQTVEALERDSGMPVIAHCHAGFFAAFRALGIKDPIQGHGRLLASLAEPAR
jgi:maleate cis-trans isomerase